MILALFEKHEGRYGYRRIYLELKAQGYVINRKKVQRLLKVYNGEIIGMGMSKRPTLDFVLESLHQALPVIGDRAAYRTTLRKKYPCLFHLCQ